VFLSLLSWGNVRRTTGMLARLQLHRSGMRRSRHVARNGCDKEK
jgi:hypothetical protein